MSLMYSGEWFNMLSVLSILVNLLPLTVDQLEQFVSSLSLSLGAQQTVDDATSSRAFSGSLVNTAGDRSTVRKVTQFSCSPHQQQDRVSEIFRADTWCRVMSSRG